MTAHPAVLVAEHEVGARETLCARLEDEGYRVHRAADGFEASRILLKAAVDAALLDMDLSGKDGPAILRELQKQESAPAVLVMTDSGNSAAAIRAIALGACDYLTRPVKFEELRTQLERAIECRPKRDVPVARGAEFRTPDSKDAPEIIQAAQGARRSLS